MHHYCRPRRHKKRFVNRRGAMLPELVVELLRVHAADCLLLLRRHLRPHVLPQVGRVEDVPRVGVHRAPLVALERLAVLEPLVQRVLGARVLRGGGGGGSGALRPPYIIKSSKKTIKA